MLHYFSHVGLFATPWTVAQGVLCPWNSPDKNTGVDCHALLQGIFPIQWSNTLLLSLLHSQAGSLPLAPTWEALVKWTPQFKSDQIRSVTQSCLTLCNPMNRSMPGLPVHHQLPEFTQTHVHRVSDAIQPSHPLSSPSPLAPNSPQHQSLFQWVNSSHQVAKLLEFQL